MKLPGPESRPGDSRFAPVLATGALILFAFVATASAATVTVNDAGDSTNACATTGAGTCTLRDAITYANAHSGSIIAFNIAGAGVHTITPATQLPNVLDPVTIDGHTQPGASQNTNGQTQGAHAVLPTDTSRVNTPAANGGAACIFAPARQGSGRRARPVRSAWPGVWLVLMR